MYGLFGEGMSDREGWMKGESDREREGGVTVAAHSPLCAYEGCAGGLALAWGL